MVQIFRKIAFREEFFVLQSQMKRNTITTQLYIRPYIDTFQMKFSSKKNTFDTPHFNTIHEFCTKIPYICLIVIRILYIPLQACLVRNNRVSISTRTAGIPMGITLWVYSLHINVGTVGHNRPRPHLRIFLSSLLHITPLFTILTYTAYTSSTKVTCPEFL